MSSKQTLPVWLHEKMAKWIGNQRFVFLNIKYVSNILNIQLRKQCKSIFSNSVFNMNGVKGRVSLFFFLPISLITNGKALLIREIVKKQTTKTQKTQSAMQAQIHSSGAMIAWWIFYHFRHQTSIMKCGNISQNGNHQAMPRQTHAIHTPITSAEGAVMHH